MTNRTPTLAFFLVFILSILFQPATAKENFYLKGTIYQDFLGLTSGTDHTYHRLSTRLKLTLWNKPGDGWTVSLDIRDRFKLGELTANQLIIYDMKLNYEKPDSKFFISMGQMNLYDTAGIGELTGGLAGIKLGPYFSTGAYFGIEPDIYNTKWDPDYRKMGIFLRYLGRNAKQFGVGYHVLTYSGETERQFLYSTILLPVKNLATFYGCAEYELSSIIHKEDRLSHLFFNSRLNLTKYLDITCHFSSGRGLDYHRFLLENSQNPSMFNEKIERFYYSQSYGIRFSVKPMVNWRIFLSRRESEHKDKGIQNHTTQVGTSVTNLFNTGISLFGYYNINQGEVSESDSISITCSRSFGKLSLNLGYSNFYSQIRTNPEGDPEILYKTDQHTLLADLFLIVNRALAISLEYGFTFDGEFNSNQYCIRIIYRKRPK